MPIKIRGLIKSRSNYQDKLFHPAKTIKNGIKTLRKLKLPITVKFKRLDRIDKLNIPTYICEMNETAKKIYPKYWMFGYKGYGKGRTLIQSKASAIMELLERFSCCVFFKNDGNFLVTACNKIKDKTVSGFLFSSLPKKYEKDAFICKELKNTSFKWAKSFSLTRNKDIIFPIDWFVNNTIGFASGNCVEEAILQGIGEVIERHIISIVTEKKLTTPLINVDSIKNAGAKKLIAKFNQAGIKLFIKDFSCGYDIPTIGILAYDPKGPESVKIYCTAGTSLNKNIALIRALTEMAQHRAQSLSEKLVRPQTYGFPYYKSLKEAEYLTNSGKIVNFSELPTYSNKNFRIEIKEAVKRLKKKGLEIIVTETTHPIIKIPAVIITMPGIQLPYHHLYDNPYLKILNYHTKNGNYHKSVNLLRSFFKYCPFKKTGQELLFPYILRHEKLSKSDGAAGTYEKIISFLCKSNKDILIETYKILVKYYALLKKPDEMLIYCQKLKKLS